MGRRGVEGDLQATKTQVVNGQRLYGCATDITMMLKLKLYCVLPIICEYFNFSNLTNCAEQVFPIILVL